jgi:DNA-binding MarR family transcriptional regulator
MNHSKENTAIQKDFFNLLFQIQIRMKEVVQDTDSGLSPLQILVIRTLAEENEMSLINVAQKLGRDKSQITRLIQDLEKKHIVIKERSKIDKRSFILKVNENVRKKISFFIEKEKELLEEILVGISDDDRQKLKELFEIMLGNLKKK